MIRIAIEHILYRLLLILFVLSSKLAFMFIILCLATYNIILRHKHEIYTSLLKMMLKSQSKLQFTQGEFISVKSTYDMTKLPNMAKPFSIYTLLISRHNGHIAILWLLFADKNISKQPVCQQNSSLIMYWCFHSVKPCVIALTESQMPPSLISEDVDYLIMCITYLTCLLNNIGSTTSNLVLVVPSGNESFLKERICIQRY